MDSDVESTVMINTSNFGGWEAHTRGIGSKLMLKMGYEYGKGKCKCTILTTFPVLKMPCCIVVCTLQRLVFT